MGKTQPLSDKELEALSTVEDYEPFPAFTEYVEQTEELIGLVESMVMISKPDDERQEDADALDELTDAIKEGFILTVTEIQKDCGTTDKFLTFAAQFILDQTNDRVSKLREIFGNSDEQFVLARPKWVRKRVAKIAAATDVDKDLPDKIGLCFAKMLDEDMDTVFELMNQIYRDHDIRDMKAYKLRICEMLEKLHPNTSGDEGDVAQ